MHNMLNRQWYRLFTYQLRPTKILLVTLTFITLSSIIYTGSVPSFQTVERFHKGQDSKDGDYANGKHSHRQKEQNGEWDIDVEDPRYWSYATDHEDPDLGEPGDVGRPRQEEELRRIWSHAYDVTAR